MVTPKRQSVPLKGKKKKVCKNPWFRLREKKGDKWGFIPIDWKGYVALVLFIGLNVFSAVYFGSDVFVVDNYLKMGVVFLLSVFIFIEIAKRKTKGVKG